MISELEQAIRDFIQKAPAFPEEAELAEKVGRLLGDSRAVKEHLESVCARDHQSAITSSAGDFPEGWDDYDDYAPGHSGWPAGM